MNNIKTYSLFTLINGRQTIHEFGKCREGLEAAYSYAENADAWFITFNGELIDHKKGWMFDLHNGLSVR